MNNLVSLFIPLAFFAIAPTGTFPVANATAPDKAQHLAAPDALPAGLSASDWTSVRAAWQAHRHGVVPVDGGQRARNPEQQWRVDFDSRGFLTRPDAGGWQWGLELKSYGHPGRKHAVQGTARGKLSGNRLTYRRDASLWEWFVNDQRGLEHGFTVAQPPAGSDEPDAELEVDLAVRGNLHPEIAPGGIALRFLDGQGKAKVTYSELQVWDADGRALPARFVPQPDGVRLRVQTGGARYPITIDPLAQQAYLKASNTGAGDVFGRAVAMSGDTLVVTAQSEASNATGVNGDQSDNSAVNAGAAYVFVREGTTWTQQAYLKASNSEAGDVFGFSAAISGDTVVIGAFVEDSAATGINGDQSDNSAPAAGAAYVFVRNGTTWSQQAYLKASNTDGGDQFGFAVAIDGDTLVVGANFESSNATGINGNETDNSAGGAGAAYVFVRNGTTWTQQAYVKPSNTDALDRFGTAVAISGDTMAISSLESSNATGINGNQADNSATESGAAFVFVRSGGIWSQQAYIKASNTDAQDLFGFSLALSDDTLVVASYAEDSNATGINGDQGDNSASLSGAAYVFVRESGTWTQQAYLKASNTGAEDHFGFSVALSGDTVVVGASSEDSNATGINGDEADNSALDSGAAYVFVRDGETWSQQAYLKASNTGTDDSFGLSVAVSDGTVIVGAPGEDSNATGVNGDESQNSAVDSGAAYVFIGLPTTLANISTRLRVETGDNVLIGGFIITGAESKRVLVRAIGPSLPLAGPLADPFLELRDGAGDLIASNDNWMNSPNKQEIIDTTIPPTNDLESAILGTFDPGLYTAIMRGVNDTTGIGLIEVYDLENMADSELANISTRGFVQTGDNVMIGGFILVGPSAQDILVRAIGPSLPLAGALADPTLDLFDSNGMLLVSNDDWRDDQETEIMATGIPPTEDAESAILMTLTPAAYTAIVRGKNDTTGIALVEAYNLGQ